MTDWGTLPSLLPAAEGFSRSGAASLATAAGTLVLAVATFAAVRSSNRSARIAEVALQEQRRPVLVQSRLEDPLQKINFIDGHWVGVSGGGGVAEHVDGIVYLAMSLRNVGAGIGVLQGWSARPGFVTSQTEHTGEQEFRRQTRDLYIPPGDVGLWQGALRDPSEDVHTVIAEAAERRQPISVELLYTDQVGGQRTISRFNLVPVGDDAWLTTTGLHFYLDQHAPR
jgi:hypothetical protein